MAIYTQYGRYLKAKAFKEALEKSGNTYMALGIGNPQWDDSNSGQTIPVASYDTTSISKKPEAENQFYDKNLWCGYISNNSVVTQIQNGVIPNTENYARKTRNLIPPFPCIWMYNSDIQIVDSVITQNNYSNLYASLNEDKSVIIHTINDDAITDTNIGAFSALTDVQSQYVAELIIRGNALAAGYKAPVGLLGMVKCDISFVKDIGENYTGDINQFWYGDRYWEIVDPSETYIEDYINDTDTYYPHHLLVSANINPRQLCTDLSVDVHLVPRQIAIYTCSKDFNASSYRVGDYIFNFGQYTIAEIDNLSEAQKAKVLNFTLPCKATTGEYSKGDFKFLLHDYIKGNGSRADHVADRIAYVIGF